MEFGDLSEEKPEQLMTLAEQRGITQAKDVPGAAAELLARKAVGESSLAYLNKEASRYGDGHAPVRNRFLGGPYPPREGLLKC
jgi:hypothetical protein